MSEYVRQSKHDYATLLIANGDPNAAKELMDKDIFSPIMRVREVHPQLEPEPKAYNEMITETYHDIYTLYMGIRETAQEFQELMTATDMRLKNVMRDILIEKEKQEDLNILCNQYTDFNSVVTLDDSNLSGNYSIADGVISAKIKNHEAVNYSINSIEGNGYEGNEYVYKDNKFLHTTIDTSSRRFITDNNNITVYEYSRITASNTETEVFRLVNFDSIETKMTLTAVSKSDFNKVKLSIASKDTIITDVSISQDGVTFTPVLSQPVYINDDMEKYKDNNYLANSGLLCFPNTKYVKITLESNGITDDRIAFEKTDIVEVENKTEKTSSELAQFYRNDETPVYNKTKRIVTYKGE